jgi:hypothetical protein
MLKAIAQRRMSPIQGAIKRCPRLRIKKLPISNQSINKSFHFISPKDTVGVSNP